MQVIPNKYLSTNLNRLEAGPSSLLRAKNVRIDGGRVRQRNGQNLLNPQDPAFIDIAPGTYYEYKSIKIFFYNGKIWGYFINLITDENDIIAYFDESNNTWHGSKMADYNVTGFFEGYGTDPVQFFESNNRLFLMTKYGPYVSPKLSGQDYSIQTTMRYAGAPAALPFNNIITANTIGSYDADWLPDNAKVAYRHVWKYVDANGTQVYGAVSDSRQLYNTDGNAQASILTIKIPLQILSATGDIARMSCEVYRTQTSIVGVNGVTPDPGDQMFLVAQLRPTTADIAAGTMQFTDIISDAALQGPLYTNETQQGAASSRIRAPIAQAMTNYDGCAWYGNITNRYSLAFDLVGVRDSVATSTRGFDDGDIIAFADIAIEFKTTPTMAVNQAVIDNTTGYAAMFDRIIKTVQNGQKVYNEYDSRPYFNLNTVSGPNQIAGTMVLQEMRDALVPTTFKPYIGLYRDNGWPTNIGDDPSPIVPTPLVSENKGYGHKITRIQSAGTGALIQFDISGTVEFDVGDIVNLARPQYMEDVSLPAGSQGDGVQYFTPGQYEVIGINVNTITLKYIDGANLTHAGAAFNQQIGVAPFATTWTFLGVMHCVRDAVNNYESQAVGVKRLNPGRVMHSAFQEPENAPALNYYDIGATDKQIIQMVSFGRFIYVFKEDGLYRISGNYPAYSVEQFDPNIILIGKDLVTSMGGSLYAWTTNGIYEITQTDATRISYDIQQDIAVITTNSSTQLKRYGFAVGNEDDHSVTFWAHNYRITKSGNFGSAYNNIGFVFDGQGWTTRTDQALSACMGVDSSGISHLYTMKQLGTGWLTKERRTCSAQDFADETLSCTVTPTGATTATILVSTDATQLLLASNIPLGSCLIVNGEWSQRAYITSIAAIADLQYEVELEFADPATTTADYGSTDGQLSLSFTSEWQYGINADGDPLVRKHFTDIGILAQQPYFTKMDIGFSSDVRPAETFLQNNIQGFLQLNYDSSRIGCTLPDEYLQDKVLKAIVATAYSRCSHLRVSFRHKRAFEYISVYGYFVRTSQGGMNIERNNDATS